jgi:hypothetical protein
VLGCGLVVGYQTSSQRASARQMPRGLAEASFKKAQMARVGVDLHESYSAASALDGAVGMVAEYRRCESRSGTGSACGSTAMRRYT